MNKKWYSIFLGLSLLSYAPTFSSSHPMVQREFPSFTTFVQNIVFSALNAFFTIFYENTFEQNLVQVRIAAQNELCEQEKIFLQSRAEQTHAALEQFLGASIAPKKAPRIAFCFSGGGFRAMMATLGFLKGSSEIGLVNSATYMSGLSGSTWALASWIASGKSLADYLHTLGEYTQGGLQPITDSNHITIVSDKIVQKFVAGQKLSAVDLYGDLLAQTLLKDFGPKCFSVSLRETHTNAITGQLPLPIYTAVTPTIDPYQWFEFTPFEMGSSFTKTYIPIWAYGRTFSNGVAQNFSPELSLGYLLGIFGSAFDVGVSDLVRIMHSSVTQTMNLLPYALKEVTEKLLAGAIADPTDDYRIVPSKVSNFSYNLNGVSLQDKKWLTLVDAGIDFNLPFPPLLRKERKVDIIIVYDASADNDDFNTLLGAKMYAIRNKLPFPEIDIAGLDKELVRVFKDEKDPECPVVIYFPMKKNDSYKATFDPIASCKNGYCSTFNFAYNQEQINELAGLTEFTVKQHKELIKNTICEVVARK